MATLEKARQELQKANGRLLRMVSTDTLEKAEGLWIDALHHLERAHNKIEAQLKHETRFKGWPERGKVQNLRRSDPLLAYLVNARGAAEHTIADLTTKTPGGIGINPASGNSLRINRLQVSGNRVDIDSPDALSIRFDPAKLTLLPVTNRGRTYDAPTVHLGQQLVDASPLTVAQTGHDFYARYITDIETYLSAEITSHSTRPLATSATRSVSGGSVDRYASLRSP